MNEDFQSVLSKFHTTFVELVDQNNPTMSTEHRALLVKLGLVALDALHGALWQGPDNLAAIKLVMQMCGMIKDQSKPAKLVSTQGTL